MIKLLEILKELERPSDDSIYAPGYKPGEESNDEFIKKGYKTITKVNPETGKEESEVLYLPKFDEIRKNIIKDRKEIQPFKFSSNPDIAKMAKDTNTLMTKLAQMVFALDKMIELERKSR